MDTRNWGWVAIKFGSRGSLCSCYNNSRRFVYQQDTLQSLLWTVGLSYDPVSYHQCSHQDLPLLRYIERLTLS